MRINQSTFFRVLWVMALMLVGQGAFSQTVLKKEVSITAENVPLESVLELIEEEAGFVFSYASDLIPVDRSTTVKADNQPVEDLLVEVLGDDLKYLERGSYVIIQKKKPVKVQKKQFEVAGQLVDAKTGANISNATIYEVNGFKSTTSSESGYYNFKLSEKADYVQVAIAKENYKDTVLELRKEQLKDLVIELEPLENQEVYAHQKSTDTLALVQMLVSRAARDRMNNVVVYRQRVGQASFLPFLGTNGSMSGRTTNNFSFNALAGYSFGVRGLELGGFANITRQHVYGGQIAGFGNVVGGRVNGLQVAGFVNVNKMEFNGIQVAGFVNTVANRFNGLQVAGFVNVSPEVKGVQVAGFANTAWSKSNTHQFSGFANMTKTNSGSQWSGFANVGLQEFNGAQVVGFANYASEINGAQIAGFVNVASRSAKGIQIAGFLNYAKTLKGVQIGLFNVSDTIESGVSIGLLNFVRKGMQDVELHYSESMSANLLFKTGSNGFYNILAAGYHFDLPIFSFGYGIGTRRVSKSGVMFGVELQSNSIHSIENPQFNKSSLNLLNHLHLFVGFKFKNGMALTSGPVLNGYYSRWINPDTLEFGYPILSNPFVDQTDASGNLKLSLGYRVAVSF